ncbi:threonylcarbamoyl-AMP synthase [candidate division KSB1 bacterium]|nr:threonylcarbamoyl-AMP synthase [candidate division KSB1 bacterium]
MISIIHTKVIDIYSDLDAAAQEATQILQEGGVIGYPTETVYGLGCDAFNPDAVRHIADIKGRDKNKPFLILLPDSDALSNITTELPDYVQALTRQFWPGPLTLLVRHQNQFPDDLTQGQSLIGVRVSSDPFCMAMMQSYNHPVVSTSANPAGEKPAQSCQDVIRYFENQIDAILDGGERNSQLPSTILDASTETLRLIREGAILSETIEQHLGRPIER